MIAFASGELFSVSGYGARKSLDGSVCRLNKLVLQDTWRTIPDILTGGVSFTNFNMPEKANLDANQTYSLRG
jgi:hypothetical protein